LVPRSLFCWRYTAFAHKPTRKKSQISYRISAKKSQNWRFFQRIRSLFGQSRVAKNTRLNQLTGTVWNWPSVDSTKDSALCSVYQHGSAHSTLLLGKSEHGCRSTISAKELDPKSHCENVAPMALAVYRYAFYGYRTSNHIKHDPIMQIRCNFLPWRTACRYGIPRRVASATFYRRAVDGQQFLANRHLLPWLTTMHGFKGVCHQGSSIFRKQVLGCSSYRTKLENLNNLHPECALNHCQ
jgi:hypothetical protein